MGSWDGEDSMHGGGWRTQQGGRLWNRAGQAAASRPHKVVVGRPCSPTFVHKLGGMAGEQNRLHNQGFQCQEIKPQPLIENTRGGLRRQWEELPAS